MNLVVGDLILAKQKFEILNELDEIYVSYVSNKKLVN